MLSSDHNRTMGSEAARGAIRGRGQEATNRQKGRGLSRRD